MRIYTLDLNFQTIANTIASYLAVNDGVPILIETGPASTLDTLKLRLAEHGFTTAAIKHVLVSHIHLDHPKQQYANLPHEIHLSAFSPSDQERSGLPSLPVRLQEDQMR